MFAARAFSLIEIIQTARDLNLRADDLAGF